MHIGRTHIDPMTLWTAVAAIAAGVAALVAVLSARSAGRSATTANQLSERMAESLETMAKQGTPAAIAFRIESLDSDGKRFTLRNVGTDAVEITKIKAAKLGSIKQDDFPLTLKPQEATMFTVIHLPSMGIQETTMNVWITGQEEPIPVPIPGR